MSEKTMTDYAYYYMEENKRLKKELATLQAKAKAYDEGQHEWGLFDTEGKFAVTCPNEQKHLANGWTCSKVRVCKEVDE